MDILSIIVKYSPVPLSTILVNTAFPATVRCILSTDDNAIMQSGGECLRTFISGKFDTYFVINLNLLFGKIKTNVFSELQFHENSFIRTNLFV